MDQNFSEVWKQDQNFSEVWKQEQNSMENMEQEPGPQNRNRDSMRQIHRKQKFTQQFFDKQGRHPRTTNQKK